MLRHAFELLACVRVEFKANADNAPSRRALERIGATYEGVLSGVKALYQSAGVR